MSTVVSQGNFMVADMQISCNFYISQNMILLLIFNYFKMKKTLLALEYKRANVGSNLAQDL